MTYMIYEGFFADVEKKINRIAKKCRKHGNDFVFKRVGEEVKEYKDEFDELLAMFTLGRLGQVTSESKIKPGCYNLVYLHHKEYYEQNKFKDPYKNFAPDEVIQHVTIEDSVDKIIKNE